MSDAINVRLAFDAAAGAWYVARSDVHGLRLDAATVEELVERIPGAIRDLLDDSDA